jgi:hypothetical protein
MTAVPKPQRIVDRKLLAEVRQAPCCIRDCMERAEPAHIKSRGAGGDDTPENVSPICHGHHMEQHTLGWPEFRRRHPEAKSWAEILELKTDGRVERSA